MQFNEFLDIRIAERPGKPRKVGLTMVNDMGWPSGFTEDAFRAFGEYVDILKFPSRLLTWNIETIREKIRLCERYGVLPQPGGLLIEIARAQGQGKRILEKFKELGFANVEISNSEGSDRNMAREREFVDLCKGHGFGIIGEVGKKFPKGDVTRNSDRDLNVRETIRQFKDLLDMGAKHVYWEGHLLRRVVGETGEEILARWKSVGPQIEEVVSEVGLDKIVFEVSTHVPYTHRRQQQFWWVKTFGPTVNIGNVRLDEVPLLEDIRRGVMPIFGFGELGDHPWMQSVERGKGKAEEKWWAEPPEVAA